MGGSSIASQLKTNEVKYAARVTILKVCECPLVFATNVDRHRAIVAEPQFIFLLQRRIWISKQTTCDTLHQICVARRHLERDL